MAMINTAGSPWLDRKYRPNSIHTKYVIIGIIDLYCSDECKNCITLRIRKNSVEVMIYT